MQALKYLFVATSLVLMVSGFVKEDGLTASSKQQTILDTLVGEKPYYLELRASVKYPKGPEGEAMPLSAAFIKIFNEKGLLVAELSTNKKGKCFFRVPLNRKFSVEVGKKGFVSKRLEMITKVPPEKKLVYLFPCDIDIFQSVAKLNVSVLDKPIAKINYNATQAQFGYDAAYTNKINSELKKMYMEFYKLQKEEELLNKPLKTPSKTALEK